MSKPKSRTYPVEERREQRDQRNQRERTSHPRRYDGEPNRLPHRTTESVDLAAKRGSATHRTSSDDVVDSASADAPDGYERNRSPPVVVSSSTESTTASATPQSSASSPSVEPSTTPLDRLEALETRIRQLESELGRLRCARTVVDVEPRAKRRHSDSSKRGIRNSGRPSSRGRKPLRDRNEDRNLLPKQRSGLLPKKNDNLLRRLFWP